ncbi:hypothetical protein C9424_19900 [Arthrobacter sp. H-02-3]|nr:hypothetical protein C9424_19900 [Arthrobacter sp. H-02-3]
MMQDAQEAGLITLGGLAVGAAPASSSTCPVGQHGNSLGGPAGWCADNPSRGGTGGDGTISGGGSTKPSSPPAGPTPPKVTLPPAPVYAPAPVSLLFDAHAILGAVI